MDVQMTTGIGAFVWFWNSRLYAIFRPLKSLTKVGLWKSINDVLLSHVCLLPNLFSFLLDPWSLASLIVVLIHVVFLKHYGTFFKKKTFICSTTFVHKSLIWLNRIIQVNKTNSCVTNFKGTFQPYQQVYLHHGQLLLRAESFMMPKLAIIHRLCDHL